MYIYHHISPGGMFIWIGSVFIFTDASRHILKSAWSATWKFLVFPLRHYDPHLGRDCRPLINQARLLFSRSSHCGDVNVITGNWTPGDRQGNINERRRRELEDLSLTLYTSPLSFTSLSLSIFQFVVGVVKLFTLGEGDLSPTLRIKILF